MALHGEFIDKGGNRIDKLNSHTREQLSGRQLAILPQEPWRSLDPLMRSFSQVYETYRHVSNDTHPNAKAKTEQQFSAFDLTDAKRKRPFKLSGGMGQRVSFCASIAGGAPVLLADEPTKGLDSSRIDTVIQHLQHIPASGGALIVITLEVAVAKRIGGDLIVLRDGQLVEHGSTNTTLHFPSHTYTNELINADPDK